MTIIQSEQEQDEDIGLNLLVEDENVQLISSKLEQAKTLVDANERQKAIELCQEILDLGDLPVPSAAKAAGVLRSLGQIEAADKIKTVIVAELGRVRHRLKSAEYALLPAAGVLADLGEVEAADELGQKAIEADPDNQLVVAGYLSILATVNRPEKAQDVAMTFLKTHSQPVLPAIHLGMVLSKGGFNEAALACLEFAKANCKTKNETARVEYLLASHGSPAADLDQHGMAVELFDSFALSYDQQLHLLGNNGPNLVFTTLEKLEFEKSKTRRILDAGCGTGLCSEFLRDYASELIGIDLSIKMLEVAREKGGYHFLARTDLSVLETYPEGSFDMIVCADVLVYFGALDTVFRNFNKSLKPGGWLLVTVEHEEDPSVRTGYKLYSTGRYKHSDSYLTETLMDVGFPKPKLITHARLRNDMGHPIIGTVFAVQKPALLL